MSTLLTFAASASATAHGAGDLALGITHGGSWFLRNVWLIPLLPALSFVGILFFGKRLPRGGSELGIAALGIAFVLALLTGAAWIDHRDNFHGEEVHAAVVMHAAGHGADDVGGWADLVPAWERHQHAHVSETKTKKSKASIY